MENRKEMDLQNINRITFILFWTGLVVLCSLYVTIPLLPVFASTFSLSASQAAWAGSIFSIFFAAGCLFVGVLSDRYGRKNVMIVGLVCFSFVTFLVGLSNSYSSLLVLRALQGAAAATFSPVALTYVGMMYPQAKRVTTIGIISSGFLIAGIVGQLISSSIEQAFNWNAVFLILSIIYFITTILLIIILPNDEIHHGNHDFLSVIKKFKIPFTQKKLILCNSIAIMILLSFVGMYTALGNFLSSHYSFNDQEIFYVRAAGIIGMLLSPFTGRFVQRFGMRKVLISGLVSSITGLLLMGLIQQLWLMIVMSILFVCGIAVVVPSMLALVGQLSGNEKGIATSLYTFILFIGASIGPLLATVLLKTGNLSLPFIVFGCILACGLLMAFFLFSTKEKNSTSQVNSQSFDA
ncbi:MFS transporter [Bacillus tuaregi]|uniref:MFS transporter n=1 Tax=Bacillus tuaregi TaxID=1816695 RepID=UPI0008F86D1C|nr:MFS transporter [Bacillus tuaregi]